MNEWMNEWMNEHVNDYTLIRFEIRIIAAYSIRDSIRTKISDSQVPMLYVQHYCFSVLLVGLLLICFQASIRQMSLQCNRDKTAWTYRYHCK